MATSMTDALVDILRRKRASGERSAFLESAVKEALFAPVGRPPRPTGHRGNAPPPRQAVRSSPAGGAAGPIPATDSPPSPPVAQLDWDSLAARVSQCRLCGLCQSRTRTVLEDGSRTADLMFIGEGPGRDEDQQGIPFVGVAGQLLTRMIGAMQYSRQEVYIANIVKCRPPHNRNPDQSEATACLPYLYRQIQLVAPKVIVLLGAVPLLHVLGEKGIQRRRGQWRDFRGISVMPTFHPAFLIRAPERKGETWQDLQQVMARLGKTPAGPSR